jgi:hypothetical protein
MVPLSAEEQAHAKAYANGDWSLLSYDDSSGLEVYMRKEGDKIRFLETMPKSSVDEILQANVEKANEWSGWSGKDGAVVRRIPINVYNDAVRESGYDGSGYDHKKFEQIMSNPDYNKFKVVGGKF